MHPGKPATRRDKIAEIIRFFRRMSMAILVILIPFRYRFELLSRPHPPIYKDYTDFLLFASDIALVASLFFWLISLALKREPIDFGPLYLSLPVAGIAVFSGVSIFKSVDPSLSVYHTVRLILLTGLYLAALHDSKMLIWVMLGAGIQAAVQAAIGVAQVLTQSSLGWTALQELALNPDWKGVSIVWAEGMRSLRAYGLSDHPNILGGSFAFALILVATWRLLLEGNQTAPWQRPLVAGLFALGCTGLLLTFSRSAWLALGSGMVLICVFLLRRRQMHLAGALVGLWGAAVLVSTPLLLANAPYLGVRIGVRGAFSQVGNEFRAINERRLLNEQANQIFTQHALTGVGIGAYTQALREAAPDLPIDYQPAHFSLLAAAVDSGILGAMSYTLALAAPWLALGIHWLRGKHLVLSIELVGLYGLLLGIIVVGFFDYYPWLLAPGRLWQWLAWGLWAGAYRAAQKGELNA